MWTIKYEFWGTIFATPLAFFVGKMHKKSLLLYVSLGVLALVCFDDNYISFLAGMMVYDIYYAMCKNDEESWIKSFCRLLFKNRLLNIILLLVGLFFYSINDNMSGMYCFLSYVPVLRNHVTIYRTLGSSICLLCILNNISIQRFLSNSILQLVGRISPFLYAFHWPIILCVGCWMYVVWNGMIYKSVLIGVIFVTTFTLSILIAILYTKLDRKVNQFIQYQESGIKNRFFREKQ